MSELLEIEEQLRDTSEAIAKTEQAVATDPSSAAARSMLRSFERRRQRLESEFSAVAKEMGVDVCAYRFFSDLSRPLAAPLCSAIVDFQNLYSLAYDAIKHGAKKTARRLPPDVVQATSFGFGYTFTGSLGVVLTFENSDRLLIETALDESMREIAALAQARSSADVLACGKRLGAPVVRAAHRWASNHADSSFGAEIAWKKGADVLVNLLMEAEQFSELVEAISATTETTDEEIEMVARLAGADVDKKRFHLTLEDGEISGAFSNEIPAEQTFEVGRPYKVKLRKRVKVYYSTEKEESATYYLLAASPSSWPSATSPAP